MKIDRAAADQVRADAERRRLRMRKELEERAEADRQAKALKAAEWR